MDIKNCRSSALFTDISSGGSKQFVFHANDYILFRFLVINVSKILLQMQSDPQGSDCIRYFYFRLSPR